MKIGLFGGTFNPVHFGHLRAALEVGQGFGLERVILIPAAVPPHKERGGVAAAADRAAMLALAVEGCPALAVSDVETRRPGPSYTIDTVRHFRGSLPADAELFLVMGLDAFLEIDSWKAFRELLGLVPVVVLSRPGADPASCGNARQERQALEGFLRAKISADIVAADEADDFRAPGLQPIRLFRVTALEISSTRLRQLVAAGRPIDYLVPAKVRHYIESKGLYR
jgi:nicotinate-nucleotide adenylyltransferase